MADEIKLNWHPEEWLAKFHKEQIKKLHEAGFYVENEVKKELSTKSPPVAGPGEAPHAVTGELRRSITHVVDEDAEKCFVGTNKDYGKYLELGEHPYLEVTVRKCYPTIKQILTRKM